MNHEQETLRHIVMQEMNEERYNRRHIDLKIRAALAADAGMQAKTEQGVRLLQTYREGQYYASKMRRIAQLANLDLTALVTELFVGVAYCQRPELFTSVSAQLASRLRFSDRAEAITTVAELLAILCITDAYDIVKEDRLASLMVVSRIPLPREVIDFIEDSEYLPPMVCAPKPLENNYSSGYLTHSDSLMLGGSVNHHDGDLCLDVLNTMNRVPLKLDLQFLSSVEEQPTYALETPQQQEQWDRFKRQSYRFYSLMQQCGNRFWLTHKVDKRGRIYSCGFHINSQGTAFKKAMLEFADEGVVDGVPT